MNDALKIGRTIGLIGGGLFMAYGTIQWFGTSWLSLVALAIFAAAFESAIRIRDAEKMAEESKRQGFADGIKMIFDQDLEQGHKHVFNGKEWKAGCRIDPKSNAVIEPA